MLLFYKHMSHGRIAASVFFFINGLLLGAWAPMIPTFKQNLVLTDSELGIVILTLGLGALITMPLVGAYITRNGTRNPLLYLSIICSPGLTLLALVPNFWVAVFVMFIFGASWSGMDVSMNANVIEIERMDKIPIMSSCHGCWSLGALSGSLGGGLTLTILGDLGHGIFWQVVFLLLAFYAFTNLQTDETVSLKQNGFKWRFPRSILLYSLGLLVFFSIIPEGIIIDWSALFLMEERNVDLAMAGAGYAATSTAMAFMRFLGDHLRIKYGAILIFKISVITTMVGFGMIAFFSSPVIAIAGFFIAGLGIANLFPIAISAAGNLPDIPSGIAVSMVTTIGYGGILLMPPLFGIIAEKWDYEIIYAIMPFWLIMTLFLLYPIRYADISSRDKT